VKKIINTGDGQYGLPIWVRFEDGSEISLADVLNELRELRDERDRLLRECNERDASERAFMHRIRPTYPRTKPMKEPIGPITPRPARDKIEGEAIAPTDHNEFEYCPVSWERSGALCCTRPVHKTGDHVVGEHGKIIARWPMERKTKKRS